MVESAEIPQEKIETTNEGQNQSQVFSRDVYANKEFWDSRFEE